VLVLLRSSLVLVLLRSSLVLVLRSMELVLVLRSMVQVLVRSKLALARSMMMRDVPSALPKDRRRTRASP
jgi:hypothetical protein